MNRVWRAAAVAVVAAGCTGRTSREIVRETPAAPHQVAYSGAGVALGELGKPGVTPEVFARRTAELLQAGRRFSAAQYVDRYPDVAAELVRTPSPGVSPEVTTFVTNALGERPPVDAVQGHLKESETLRQANRLPEAAAAWGKAATAAAERLARRPGALDPALWEHLASLRPVQATWPTGVQATLARTAAGLGVPHAENAFPECLLWAITGRWHLERNEAHAAVAAFKRAETLTVEAAARDTFRIWQAQALVAIGQESTAVGLLVPLTTNPDPVVAGPALATVGAVKLNGGAAKQARPMLEKALALPDVWRGRPEAMGDLAIALLFLGDEPGGVDCLHAAQNAFQMAGDVRGMLRAMNNEAEYWAAKGSEPRAVQVRDRMAQIEGGSEAATVQDTQALNRTAGRTGSPQKPNLFTIPTVLPQKPR